MKLTHFFLTTAALAVAATTATAATITWGAATNINPAGGAASDLDVSTTGTLVRAFNLGPGATGTTVNGVNFEAFAIPTKAPSVTIGNFTLATAAVGGLTSGNFPVVAPPFSNLSASYQNLLGPLAYTTMSDATMTLTMTGLTMGQSYAFQWWSNLSPAFKPGVTDGTAGTSVTLDYNTTDFQVGLGQFAIGTFLADSASQAITFTPNAGGQPYLNGFQLRQLAPPIVPEPGTAIFGLALAGTALTRRGRRG